MHAPSFGGISVTDLSISRIFYPLYGIGRAGKGILMAYILEKDAVRLRTLSDSEKVQVFLCDLQKLYPDVNIAKEYEGGTDIGNEKFLNETLIIDWTLKWHKGALPLYCPGQLSQFYPIVAQKRRNFYFAGDHLGIMNKYTTGAIELPDSLFSS